MVSYNRLWETMEKRKISQYRLIKEFGLSSGQMSRLKKNTYVSTHTLETLCRILDCRIEDVMEVSFEDVKAEMDYLRGKRTSGGKVSIKKFIDGLMLEAER